MEPATFAAHALSSIVGSWWNAGRGLCVCEVRFVEAASPPKEVLEPLGQQLSRCGPEKLGAAPPQAPLLPSVAYVACVLVLIFVAGAIAGFSAGVPGSALSGLPAGCGCREIAISVGSRHTSETGPAPTGSATGRAGVAEMSQARWWCLGAWSGSRPLRRRQQQTVALREALPTQLLRHSPLEHATFPVKAASSLASAQPRQRPMGPLQRVVRQVALRPPRHKQLQSLGLPQFLLHRQPRPLQRHLRCPQAPRLRWRLSQPCGPGWP